MKIFRYGSFKECVFSLQHVNEYDSRLKFRMQPIHGVATQCLSNSIGWRA